MMAFCLGSAEPAKAAVGHVQLAPQLADSLVYVATPAIICDHSIRQQLPQQESESVRDQFQTHKTTAEPATV